MIYQKNVHKKAKLSTGVTSGSPRIVTYMSPQKTKYEYKKTRAKCAHVRTRDEKCNHNPAVCMPQDPNTGNHRGTIPFSRGGFEDIGKSMTPVLGQCSVLKCYSKIAPAKIWWDYVRG